MKNIAFAVLIIALAACSDTPPAPSEFPPGTYMLTEVNGQPVPAQMVPSLTLSSGTISILDAEQFTAKTCYNGCQLSRWEQGRYTRDGNSVTLATLLWSRFIRDDGTLDSLPNHYIRTLTIHGDELRQNGGGDFAGFTLTYMRIQ